MKYLNRSMSLLIAALLVSGVAVTATNTNGVSAIRCETPSPHLVQLGEKYYDLDANENISKLSATDLEHFYHRLEGRWTGEQTSNDCKGTGESRRVRISELLLENVRTEALDNGRLILRADKELVRVHSETGRHVAKIIRPNHRTDFYAATDLMNLEFIDKNSVTMTKRYRRSNNSHRKTYWGYKFPAGSTLVERVDALTLDAKKLTIETAWYHNGYFSGNETIHLTRR